MCGIRLQKLLTDYVSRRKAEELITAGLVKVNGQTVTQLGCKVDPTSDIVEYDGKIIALPTGKAYYMLNKPVGYVCTAKDQFGRPTVLDLVTVKERVYPVGRLDYDTSGLLLLTNDGELTNALIHPRGQVNKIYLALVKGTPSAEAIQKFCGGVNIGGYTTAPALLKIVERRKNSSLLKIIIHEGKNRQVRKMCEAIGHPVINLTRVEVAGLQLGSLKPGEYRKLSEDEVEWLKSTAGLSSKKNQSKYRRGRNSVKRLETKQ